MLCYRYIYIDIYIYYVFQHQLAGLCWSQAWKKSLACRGHLRVASHLLGVQGANELKE